MSGTDLEGVRATRRARTLRWPRKEGISTSRLLRWSLAVVLLGGACAADSAATAEATVPVTPATTSSTVTTTTSTTPVSTTTTTPGPVDISIDDEPSTTHDITWEEGASYVATRFFTPVAFVSPTAGWMSRGAGERWVSLVWNSPEDDATVSLSVLAYQQGLTRQEVAESVGQIEGVDVLSVPMAVIVSGYDAVSFDVFGQEKDSALEDYQCTTQLGRWNWDSSGYPLVPFTEETEEGWEYGIPACFRSKVWVVSSADGTVTIVATPLDPDRYEELVSTVEPLLESFVIGG